LEEISLQYPELKNRVAIVTGAAQGIGKAVATLLSEHGVRLIVNDISAESAKATARAICASGYEAVPVIADVTNHAAVEDLIQECISAFSRIDILVNNAGVLRPTRLPHIPEQEWDLVVDSNLRALSCVLRRCFLIL
jgi:3-oxoacyl-[acyl-carrier protein] reductase